MQHILTYLIVSPLLIMPEIREALSNDLGNDAPNNSYTFKLHAMCSLWPTIAESFGLHPPENSEER